MADVTIKLRNRYNEDVGLKLVDEKEGTWKFYCPDFLRVIYSDAESSKVAAIDPSGGPYLSIGGTYSGIKKEKDTEENINFTVDSIDENSGYFLKITVFQK